FTHDRAEYDSIFPEDVEAFWLEAARRRLARQAARIPSVAEMLGATDPDSLTSLDQFIPFLFDEDAYKTYDPAWLERQDYAALTAWMGRYTANDYSAVDMAGCASLTEWCRRIQDQTGDMISHSSGTSGTLSFVPRSRADQDLFGDALMWNFQSQAPGARREFFAGEPNDVALFSTSPRHMFRITSGIFDALERRYGMTVRAFEATQPPEFAIAQARIRRAERQGRPEALADDPIVARFRHAVEEWNATAAERMSAWVTDLVENFRDRRVIVQGSFDLAWAIVLEFKARGIESAFGSGSILSVIGGIKDGSTLPADWQEQLKATLGLTDDSYSMGWGMSEINGGLRQCPGGKLHFGPHIVPFVLEPGTRQPKPRQGVQTGQLALLDLVSEDNWGGMVSGDAATVHWDGGCGCGRTGPFMDPATIHRV
ncbi:MAG: hypothetical protein ABW194_11645, partial [Novosphingobium sp.]